MTEFVAVEPAWELRFDERGHLKQPAQDEFVAEVGTKEVTDLFMFSHGWDTSQDSASSLFGEMFPMIQRAAQSSQTLGRTGFVGIYWPSLWFPPAPVPEQIDAAEAAGAFGATSSTGSAQLTGGQIVESLVHGFGDTGQRQTVITIGQLIDEGRQAVGNASDGAKQEYLARIHSHIKSLVRMPAGNGHSEDPDAGELDLLCTDDPVGAYQRAGSAFNGTPTGGAHGGVGDWFTKSLDGAKEVLRVFSFWTMKERAGTIGQTGFARLLVELHDKCMGIRVHLIGHSFGARLVSFALAGIDSAQASPVASLTLLEGAFSHWSFTAGHGNPIGTGILNAFCDRVHGPIIATHTIYDYAVGVWYPIASRLARQTDGGPPLPNLWGALGSDGFQPHDAARDVTMSAAGGVDYGFRPGVLYRVNAADVINNTTDDRFGGAHSDIRKAPVAELIVAAASVFDDTVRSEH